MTHPTATAKLMLLEDKRGGPANSGSVPVRRFRLARLRFDAAATDSRDRFEYLRRAYD